MKNILLSIGLIFIGVLSIQAQFTVATTEGTPITDGSIFTYNILGDGELATLGFNITNTSANQIDMRMEFVSLANADDTGDWVCIFGLCTPPPSQTPGTIFPHDGVSDEWTLIEPGETAENGDHMWNSDPGDGTNYPLEYVFKLYELNGNGDPITFAYRYDPDYVSVEEMPQVGYKLYPNVSSDFVNLVLEESVSAQLINTQGQIIEQYYFESGNHSIDVSPFTKQLYYLRLSNKHGQQALAKILVK